jgi:hypothetical protein
MFLHCSYVCQASLDSFLRVTIIYQQQCILRGFLSYITPIHRSPNPLTESNFFYDTLRYNTLQIRYIHAYDSYHYDSSSRSFVLLRFVGIRSVMIQGGGIDSAVDGGQLLLKFRGVTRLFFHRMYIISASVEH